MARRKNKRNKAKIISEVSERVLRSAKKKVNLNEWTEKDISKNPESPSIVGQTITPLNTGSVERKNPSKKSSGHKRSSPKISPFASKISNKSLSALETILPEKNTSNATDSLNSTSNIENVQRKKNNKKSSGHKQSSPKISPSLVASKISDKSLSALEKTLPEKNLSSATDSLNSTFNIENEERKNPSKKSSGHKRSSPKISTSSVASKISDKSLSELQTTPTEENISNTSDSLNSTFSPPEPKFSAQYLNSQNITPNFKFSLERKNLTPFHFRGSSQSKAKTKSHQKAAIEAYQKREKENSKIESKKRKFDAKNEPTENKNKRSRVTFEDSQVDPKFLDQKVRLSAKRNTSILKTRQNARSTLKTPLIEKNSNTLKSNVKSSVKKIPDFSSIHKKMFSQMDSIDDVQQKKSERVKKLFFSTPASKTVTSISANPISNLVVEKTKNVKKSLTKIPKKIPRSQVGVKFQEQKPSVIKKQLKEYVKGVRTNRRFELLMEKRNINK